MHILKSDLPVFDRNRQQLFMRKKIDNIGVGWGRGRREQLFPRLGAVSNYANSLSEYV